MRTIILCLLLLLPSCSIAETMKTINETVVVAKDTIATVKNQSELWATTVREVLAEVKAMREQFAATMKAADTDGDGALSATEIGGIASMILASLYGTYVAGKKVQGKVKP